MSQPSHPDHAQPSDKRSASIDLGTMTKQGRSLSGYERHCCFLNLTGTSTAKGRFANISAVSGLDLDDDGRGLLLVDWDHDGDQDIWISNRNAPRIRFMRNDISTGNHFLAVRLIGNGTTTNRDAIGARVEVALGTPKAIGTATRSNVIFASQVRPATTVAPPLIKTLQTGEGFLSQNSKWLHFGLGQADQIIKLTVHWPGGQTEEFVSLQPNQHYELVQGTGASQLWETQRPTTPLQSKLPAHPSPANRARAPLMTLMPMPKLAHKTFDDVEQTLTFGNGKPVLVNLWASWCAPCIQELKEFTTHEKELREANITVVALTVDGLGTDQTDPAIAQELIDQLGFSFSAGRATPDLINTLQQIHDLHIPLQQPLPIPSSFLIDADGKLSVIYKGPVTTEDLLTDLHYSKHNRDQRLNQTTGLSGRAIQHPRIHHLMDRDDAQLLYQAARLVTQVGDLDTAKRTYEEIIQLAPDFAQAHSKLGIICLRLNETESAEKHLHSALRLEPTLAAALYNLGSIKARTARPADAEQYYRRAIEVHPNFTEAHFNLAIVLFNQRNFSTAKVHLNKAHQLTPNNPQIIYNRGLVNAALGEHEMAMGDYSLMIQQHPNHAEAYINRANSSLMIHNYELALSDCSQAIKLRPQEAHAYYNRGKIYQLRGETRKALDDYFKVLELHPNHMIAHNNVAWMLATSAKENIRNGEKAIASAQRACSAMKSERYDFWDTLAAAYAENRDFKNAIAWQAKAIQLAPEHAKSELTARLKLYQRKTPYRETGSN